MNGIHIEQVFISGVMLGILYDEDYDELSNVRYKRLTFCFFVIGIKFTIW